MASFWAGILIIHHHSICHDLWHLVLIHCGGLQPSPSLALSLRWWRLRQKNFMMLERYNRLQSSEIDKHVKETFYHNLSLEFLRYVLVRSFWFILGQYYTVGESPVTIYVASACWKKSKVATCTHVIAMKSLGRLHQKYLLYPIGWFSLPKLSCSIEIWKDTRRFGWDSLYRINCWVLFVALKMYRSIFLTFLASTQLLSHKSKPCSTASSSCVHPWSIFQEGAEFCHRWRPVLKSGGEWEIWPCNLVSLGKSLPRNYLLTDYSCNFCSVCLARWWNLCQAGFVAWVSFWCLRPRSFCELRDLEEMRTECTPDPTGRTW